MKSPDENSMKIPFVNSMKSPSEKSRQKAQMQGPSEKLK